MRIPSYVNKIPYQQAHARSVTLARPLLDDANTKSWEGLALAGVGLQMSGLAVRAIELWNEKREEKKKKQQQGKSPSTPPPTDPTQPPAGPTLPEDPDAPSEEKTSLHEKGGTTEKNPYNGFSNQARQQLLKFSREQIFSDEDANRDGAVITPLRKLDEYAGQQLSEQAKEHKSADLWLQDYALIRDELNHVQAKAAQQQQQQQFQASASNFLETAALVRDPDTLEEYIRTNLSGATAEKQQEPPSVAWKQQKKDLYAQAVRHNIESALQTADTAQAQAVYEHFADKLPARDKELLAAKLAWCQAQNAADTLYATGENLPDKPTGTDTKEVSLRAAAQAALAGKRQTDFRRYCYRKSESYGQLAKALQTGEGTAENLIHFAARTAEEFQTAARLWQTGQQAEQVSDPEVFNHLYEQIQQRAVSSQDILQAFEKQQLSAVDTCRLEQAFYLSQTQASQPRDLLLLCAVEKLCHSYQLNPSEIQQAKYWVLSAGPDREKQLQAARELKNLLGLQEKTK